MDCSHRFTPAPPTFLLASAQPALLSRVQPAALAARARVEVAVTAEAALSAITKAGALGSSSQASLNSSLHSSLDSSFGASPGPSLDLALLDNDLPGMETSRLLAAIRAEAGQPGLPLVMIADSITQEWLDWLAEGMIDDLIPRGAEPAYWQIRIERTLRAQRLVYEVNHLRQAAAGNAQLDRLTGVYNRDAMLTMLFRETDRIQRMNGSLSLILFDLDDFGHWNSRLGGEACDEMLCQVAARTARLLRSYDLVGRMGKDEFLVALPGCATANAEMLAERLRLEVFSSPFRVHGDSIRLSACFGIASSQGRSPVVVLREAEQALQCAKRTGPEAIQCFGTPAQPSPAPVSFLCATSGDELLAW
jgi:two-component system cell cycle response regulator